MTSDNPTNGNARLEALRQREAALKTAIAAEKVRQQKRRERNDARVFSIIGEALARYAEQSPDFRLMLKQVLQSAELHDGDRAFLAGNGWL
jgi:hypothetical protein